MTSLIRASLSGQRQCSELFVFVHVCVMQSNPEAVIRWTRLLKHSCIPYNLVDQLNWSQSVADIMGTSALYILQLHGPSLSRIA